MKISVIIPTFNQQEFLSDCIDSILNQTVKPHEIIVINDGSTDNTRGILEGYEDKIKVIHQVNKGLASARNTGIMNATGDYILPLDSDDLLQDNCIERLTKVIEDTNADIVAPSFKNFGLDNSLVTLMFRPTVEDFKTGNRIGYCSAIKREALLEVGGYSPRMTWGYEDYALWFDLLKRGKTLVTIPEPLWLYRVRANSMLSTAQAHHQELMTQIAKDNPSVFAS